MTLYTDAARRLRERIRRELEMRLRQSAEGRALLAVTGAGSRIGQAASLIATAFRGRGRAVPQTEEMPAFGAAPPAKPPQRPRTPVPAPEPERITRKIGGRTRQYDPDDPIVTGEMVEVESSNVHSIGYRWNESNPMKGSILVRFLEDGAPGPTYAYDNLHPDVFEAMQIASSKGAFVWDRFRVRGTVSGHRVPYTLVGLSSSGYVPRKATRFGRNEYFIRRQVRGKNGRTYESELQDEAVQTLTQRKPPEIGVPRDGRPATGSPARGRPRR